MQRKVTSYVKGAAAGIAIGATATMLAKTGHVKKNKSFKKNAGKAIKVVGSVLDTMMR